MKRPPLRTFSLGHPLAVAPMAMATIWSIIAWLQGGDGWLVLIAIAALGIVLRASERRSAYLAFRREWDGLASPVSRPARRIGTLLALLLLLVPLAACAAGYLGLTIDQPGHALALQHMAVGAVVLVVITGIAAVVRAILRALARRRGARIVPVAVCVTRPLLAVPSLADAYRALPAYCWRILS